MLKNSDQITLLVLILYVLYILMGLSFYKNGDQIETKKKHPKVYVRNFRNFQNLIPVLQ